MLEYVDCLSGLIFPITNVNYKRQPGLCDLHESQTFHSHDHCISIGGGGGALYSCVCLYPLCCYFLFHNLNIIYIALLY